MTVCYERSEQKLADDIWPPPLNTRLFSQLTQPFLASLVAAGHDIVEARKTPDKVCLLGCLCAGWGAGVLGCLLDCVWQQLLVPGGVPAGVLVGCWGACWTVLAAACDACSAHHHFSWLHV